MTEPQWDGREDVAEQIRYNVYPGRVVEVDALGNDWYKYRLTNPSGYQRMAAVSWWELHDFLYRNAVLVTDKKIDAAYTVRRLREEKPPAG